MALEGARLGAGRRAGLDPTTIAEFLHSTALFRACDRPVIDKIAPHVAALEFESTGIIVRASAPDPSLGILFSGRASVRQVNAATGSSTLLEEIRVGDSFSEVGAVLAMGQAIEVVSEDSSIALLFEKDLLRELMTKVSAFGHAVAKRLAARVVQVQLAQLRAPAAGAAPPVAANGGAGPATTPPQPVANGDAGFRFVRVAGYDVEKQVSLLPAKMLHQYRVLPLELRNRTLKLGMVDPFNQAAAADLKRTLTSVDVEIVAISEADFNETFVRLRLDTSGTQGRRVEAIAPDSLQYDVTDQERDVAKVGVIGDEVVVLTNRILATGLERGASDVHIEGDATGVRVKFRTQGQLIQWDQFIAPSFAKGLVARIKILAGLDITERRLPQDGRIGLRVGKRDVDLRISTLPASRGEKIVIRVFEASTATRALDSLILEPRALAALRSAINNPYGAVVVAGPTGSGKSSTLYAAMGERRRMRPDTNVVTVEDPIEYRLSGVTQVQVNHSIKLGFVEVLRAMLRQDPDLILIGEVRDDDTAQLALEAAMTGHLLFTSLHANNAIGVIQRLENLGCNRALIAQSLGLVIVQRLARKLCKCATNEVPPPILLESLVARRLVDRAAVVPLPRAVGCPECSQTGYSGRVAVLELLQPTDALRAQIMAGVSLSEIDQLAADAGALIPFRRYASYLMSRQLLTPSEALLTVA